MGLAEMNVNWDQMFEEQGLEQIRQKVGDSIETRWWWAGGMGERQY